MEKWREVWRHGFLPQISTEALVRLHQAIMEDDSRLIQGSTCYPPLLEKLKDRPVEACCVIGWTGWQGGEGPAKKVWAIEEHFQRLCDNADAAFSEPAVCRYFMNAYDDMPRDDMRREMCQEIEAALKARGLEVAA